MDASIDTRRVATEAIATLVHVKTSMADFILKPAGVPSEVIAPILRQRDDLGDFLTKRRMAPLIFDEMDRRNPGEGDRVARRIVAIAAKWQRFDLAGNEFEARATVQAARALLGTLEAIEAEADRERETARREAAEREEREHAERLAREMALLLAMFDDLGRSTDPQRRGYLLQHLMNRLFDAHSVPVVRAFTRNDGAEQIDGAFKLDGWYYIVECRWRKELADIRQLDGLKGQVGRSGRQTMGVFLSIEGWSQHVPTVLKQNADKAIFLMHGGCLRAVLSGRVGLRDFLHAKLDRLNLEAEPYLGVEEFLRRRS